MELTPYRAPRGMVQLTLTLAKKMKIFILSILSAIALLIGLVAAKFWLDFPASRIALKESSFLSEVTLTDREILYHADGFVDITAYAAVPATESEFEELISTLGMIRSAGKEEKFSGRVPYWWVRPSNAVFERDRLERKRGQDFLLGHYREGYAYFYYYTV